MSMGADKALLTVSIIASVVFFTAIVPMLNHFGAAGAVLCQVMFNLVLLTGTWGLFFRLSASRDVKNAPP